MYGIPILTLNAEKVSIHADRGLSVSITLDQSLQIIVKGRGFSVSLDTVVALSINKFLTEENPEEIRFIIDEDAKLELIFNKQESRILITAEQFGYYHHFPNLSDLQLKVLSKIIEIACAGIE